MLTKLITYTDEGTTLEGFAAYPDNEKRPAVILCHAWRGRDDFICEKAKLIASWGYAAFALDMYGKGILGKSKEENAALKKPFIDDRKLLLRRALKGLDAAKTLPHVDVSRLAVVGFGFGGLCALDLVRSGVVIKAAISVYGHFEPPPFPKRTILAKILILHGYNDPVAPHSGLETFSKEMEAAKVDWQAHLYGNTLHAFATPTSNDPAAGLLYNPSSAKRADSDARHFLEEVL
jgi:dienelactone hydrolase